MTVYPLYLQALATHNINFLNNSHEPHSVSPFPRHISIQRSSSYEPTTHIRHFDKPKQKEDRVSPILSKKLKQSNTLYLGPSRSRSCQLAAEFEAQVDNLGNQKFCREEMADAKGLHWSFFVKDRIAEIGFYREILGMKVLRHHEYVEKGAHPPVGVKGMWSTTLLSYGDEYRNFSIQILFSYDPDLKFTRGNDYSGMTIQSSSVLSRAKSAELTILEIKEGVYKVVTSPAGYRFFIIDKPEPTYDPILKIHLMCSDEMNALMFWHCVLGAKVNSHYFNHSTVISFQDHGVKFKFRKTDDPIVPTSHGCRLTCSTTIDKLKELEKFMEEENLEITFPLTPLNVTNDSHVLTMIVEDFDGHEIALVDEIDYDRQAVVDDKAEQTLIMAMRKEKIHRGENPIVDENDARFFKFLNIFDDHEKCRGKNSVRILGPLILPSYLMRDQKYTS